MKRASGFPIRVCPVTYGRLEIRALQETQEELVHELQVRPARLQRGVVLFRVKVWVLTWWQRAEQVG